ncbi:Methyltransferase domain-containing protein [Bosea sp. 62]|uniref:class I SAM-dependent DNA methyltransferase n=1 Tax=unclassified Bosea (in: a-proteobacteria) TaxID=2653178 RepID=UPI0012548535|nr:MULTISPECIES: class I SAM-dependent methyltransferase [unclassified Bosea (in: a-proteobacteria)]CAD5295304.1 Methyltransferase domain-containing protein [Bosea sp. 21B]CAD5295683.1 Methyltransferase domain-containing protein [Bosea sp. 46]CAD5298213.1 Methyltransferase domain-containing protein [Bosea sp. 7B]VVT60981.1 Methyltransferase domain-containing protein [Bosea sp. EC-HK365B]VXB33954.1 Methyltransferase domain-containing protein [Bosea sp. 127]
MTDSADAVVSLYQRHAAAYDQQRGRKPMEARWLDRFLSLLPATAAVLDLGCGMGEPIARHLIERGCTVTGIDSSAPLIALCRERFQQQDWQVGDMRELALGRRFDGLIAWDSFFHLKPDDQRRMFPLFGEHAAEGAVLLFTSGPAHGEAIGNFEGEPLYHGSLDPAEYRALLDANGFAVVEHIVEDPNCGGHTIWLAQRTA